MIHAVSIIMIHQPAVLQQCHAVLQQCHAVSIIMIHQPDLQLEPHPHLHIIISIIIIFIIIIIVIIIIIIIIIMEAMEDVRDRFVPERAVMIDWPIITLEQREPIEYASCY